MAMPTGIDSEKETFNMSNAAKALTPDSTSLVDLKAEVYRKKQEAIENKAQGRVKASSTSVKEKKSNNIWSKSNVAVLKRSFEDAEKERKERIRIQTALEQKAEVYDKLKAGTYKDKDQTFLVDFQEDEDEWVEYTDVLGRTRKCHRSDLEEMKKRDMETFGSEGTSQTEAQLSLLSEDMRREQLRQKWEKEEEQNLKKPLLHYNDVLYDEARTHGAAFYRFARNESDRQSQMENLKSLHRETLETRNQVATAKAKREAAMAARLKKVRDKKRLKMGLPALPDEPEEQQPEVEVEKSVMEGLKELREAEEQKMRKSIVREWDVGKDGVEAKEATDQEGFKEKLKLSMERKVLSQEEWVEKKRKERPSEFAPPTAFAKKAKNTTPTPKYNNVPPPCAPAQNEQPSEFRPKNINFEPKYYNPSPSGSNAIPEPQVARPSSMSLGDRLRMHQQFNPQSSVPPSNFCDSNDYSSNFNQVPPPAHMQMEQPPVLTPRRVQKPNTMSLQDRLSLHQAFRDTTPVRNNDALGGLRSPNQMAEAFLCGLKSNMKTVEESDSD